MALVIHGWVVHRASALGLTVRYVLLGDHFLGLASGCWVQRVYDLDLRVLGGSGDLASRLIMGISRVTIWVIGVINLLTKSP